MRRDAHDAFWQRLRQQAPERCRRIGLREEGVAHLPFKLHRGFAIIVRGSIGNARNLNFLLDTGASPSVVDRRVAQKVHLQVSSGQLSTFTQKVAVDQSVAADIHLGPFHADQLRVLVHDLSVLEETLGVRVDAMVGYDFLKQGPFTIDYPSRTILFGPVDSQLETIPYADGLPYVVVRMHVQNAELPLLVDTGSHDLIVFENVLEGIGPKIFGQAKPYLDQPWGNDSSKTGGLLPFVPGCYAMVLSRGFRPCRTPVQPTLPGSGDCWAWLL